MSGEAVDTFNAPGIQVIRSWLYKISLGALVVLLVGAAVGYISAWAVSPRREIAVLLLFPLLILLLFISRFVRQINNIAFFSLTTAFLVITRVVWLLNIHTVPVSDFGAYYRLACDVAGGKGLTISAVHLLNGWGYPWLLGFWFRIFGCSVQNGEILNLILIIAALPLLYLLADAIGGKVAARWAVIFYVLWPAQLIFTSVLATEHLAIVLLLAGFLFGERLFNKQGNQWVNIILCGVLLTLGSIVRPAVLVILAGLVLTFLLYSIERKIFLVAAVGLILTYFLSNGAYNKALMTYNDGVVPSFAFSTAMNLYYGLNYDSSGEWSAEDNAVIFAWPEDQVLQRGIHDSLTRLGSYSPRQIFTLFFRKNQEFWATPNYAYYWSTVSIEPGNDSLIRVMDKYVFIPDLFQLEIIILVCFAGFLLLLHPDSAKLESVFLALLLATGIHLIFAVDSRYSHIFVPLLFIIGGVGLSIFNDTGRDSLEDNIHTSSRADFSNQRRQYWDQIASKIGQYHPWNQYYHRRIHEIYQNLIPPGSRVLELGCGYGDLLAALKPSRGVGVDFSPAVLEIARLRHPEITFVEADAHEFDSPETFDVIILSDLVDDLWDVECVLDKIRHYSAPSTRVIINYYSRIWAPLIAFTERQGLSVPRLQQNWLVQPDVENLLYLAGFSVIRHQREILWPFIIRPLEIFCNRFLVKLWPFNWFALANFTLACPIPDGRSVKPAPSVSIIVPARNEAGNIANIFQSVPSMGSRTELIFVEGHSTDNTYDTIEQALKVNDRPARVFRQTGKGKGDAVRLGFSEASGDILMILDADLTVRPEDLVRFYEALLTGKGDFINGVRLVYPMDKEAMRFFNFIGNKFFSLAFSWLLGQNVKDTLCGTKVLWKRDYERIASNRSYFGDFDPFGDFDLLFGAARLNMRIIDLPIRYRERTYGTTNIQRWRHGWLLLRMVAFAAFRIKFI